MNKCTKLVVSVKPRGRRNELHWFGDNKNMAADPLIHSIKKKSSFNHKTQVSFNGYCVHCNLI